jgi:plastocyanin
VRPKRTIVRNVVGWGSVLGFSATNMRYVTITGSRFFNNAVGVVPNALDSEDNPPAENNVIRDTDVFWNNFDVYKAAPFVARANEDFIYPPGTGVILLSGRENLVENNRIWGNWLGGFIAVQNVFLEATDAIDMRDNVVRGNRFGLDALDKNGRDLVYTGNGTGNCFENNAGVETTVPADPAAFPACPGPDNQDNTESIQLMFAAGVEKKYRENWLQQSHTPIQGIEPLTDYRPGVKYGPTTLGEAGLARAAAVKRKKTVDVGDYFYSPTEMTVKKGTQIRWRWLAENVDVHDVKLEKAPKGVKRWTSELAATDYEFKRTLRKRGRYSLLCTLHPDEMSMKIRVRR